MKAKTFALLTTAIMVIALTGIGNAFAYSWSSYDDSKLVTDTYGLWNTYCSGTPTAHRYDTLTWGNAFKNEYGGTYYPTLVTDGTSSDPVIEYDYPLDSGERYPSSGYTQGSYTVGGSESYSWHSITVRHWYGLEKGGLDVYVTNPAGVQQDYYVTS